jgi:23S rRNA (guanosine2251-2'-O)-methyltransferase
LDGVTDVRNMGAIARSAECFGAHALLVPKQGSAQLGSDAVKSSAGALLRIPVCRVKTLAQGLERCKGSGLRIVGCSEKSDVLAGAADLTGPLVLVMGAEGEGLSEAVIHVTDQLVRIPTSGAIGSLNVSVAAGIALYAAAGQRS